MNRVPPPPRGRPYWLLLVLAALLLSPPVWASAALIGGAIGAAIIAGVRSSRTLSAGAAGERDSAEAVVLGDDGRGRQVVLTDQQLAAHGLILGASGAGKSTTLVTILTHHIRRGLPVVAIDMKGSPAFAGQLANAATAAGRPFRAWTPDGQDHWNPFQYGNATELKDKLIATERFTEPHYQRAAERYVQTVLQVLHGAQPERAPELEEIVRMMEPARLSAMLRHLPRFRAEQVQDYLAGLTPDQLSAIRGLGTRLAIVSESHAGRYLSSADCLDTPSGHGRQRPLRSSADAGGDPCRGPIDLRAALAGREIVLFSLNSSTYGQLSAQIGTLVIQDLVAAVGSRLADIAGGDPRGRAIVGIDEFSALGAAQVVSLLARGREADVTVLLATQELADLERAAPGLRDQVLGNTAVKIAHRQDVPASAQTVAQMAGTEKAWEETHQIQGRPGHSDIVRGTRRLVEQFVIHPNEIKSLRTGHAVLITKLPRASARTVRVAPPPQRDRPTRPGGRDGPALA